MIGGVQSNNNLYNIGNVGIYSQNLVKSALADKNNSWSKVLNGISSIGLNNTPENTINNTTKNTLSFAADNAKNLNGLKNAAYSLSRAANNFGASTLKSSNTDAITTSGTSYSGSTVKYDVTVSNVATQQQQQSQALTSNASSAFGQGKNSFNIQTESGNYAIEFDVSAKDTNLDSLNNIASSINSSKAGITAKVVTEDGKSSLQMTSVETGEKSAFEITSGGSGKDAAAKMELSETQAAQDAKYSVNGQQLTSSSNTVGMPDGRAGTMTFQSAGTANISRAVDASKVVSAAVSFAQSYNSAVKHLASNTGNGAGSARALGMIDGVGRVDDRTYARLSSMGITIDEEGMKVDENKLTKAVQENPSSVKSTLGGYGGVAEKVERGASEAMRVPAATYTDFSKMKVSNSLIDSLLPKQSGLLFDLYR